MIDWCAEAPEQIRSLLAWVIPRGDRFPPVVRSLERVAALRERVNGFAATLEDTGARAAVLAVEEALRQLQLAILDDAAEQWRLALWVRADNVRIAAAAAHLRLCSGLSTSGGGVKTSR